MSSQAKHIFKELSIWLIINMVAPILVPFLWLHIASTFFLADTTLTSEQIFVGLLRNGAYIFIGTILIVSVFSSYSVEKERFTPVDYALLGISIIYTGAMFLADNPIADLSGKFSFETETSTYVLVLLSGIGLACYLKYKTLK